MKRIVLMAASLLFLCACGSGETLSSPVLTEIPAGAVQTQTAGTKRADEVLTTVKYTSRYMNMSFALPGGWEYEIVQSGVSEEEPEPADSLEPFGVRFWPGEDPDSMFELFYHHGAAVPSGADAAASDVSFENGLTAARYTERTEDGGERTLYVFGNVPGVYTLEYCLPVASAERFEPELEEILDSLKLGKGVMSAAKAEKLASAQLKNGYAYADGQFDFISGEWTISFRGGDHALLDVICVGPDENAFKNAG